MGRRLFGSRQLLAEGAPGRTHLSEVVGRRFRLGFGQSRKPLFKDTADFGVKLLRPPGPYRHCLFQLVGQRLGVLQIGGFKTLGKPAIDKDRQFVGIAGPPQIMRY